MKDENKYNGELSMSDLDKRIYNAIKRLDWYFGEKKYVICGSVGLYIQGIDLKRDFHDLDLYIPGTERQQLLRLWRLVYTQSGFKLDFPYIPKEYQDIMPEREIIEVEFFGLPVNVQEKKDILRYKQIVIENSLWTDFNNKKQKEDIEKIKCNYNI